MGAARRFYAHHDNASGLLSCAHAHNGRHANGGALEVNPAAEDRRMLQEKSAYDWTIFLDFLIILIPINVSAADFRLGLD